LILTKTIFKYIRFKLQNTVSIFIESKFTIFIFILFSGFFCHGQNTEKERKNHFDSINHFVSNHKPQLIGGFHNRNSFLSDQSVKVRGLRIGLDYEERVSLSLGYYWTKRSIKRTSYIHYQNKPSDTINFETNLRYVSLFGQYIFYNKNRFSLGFPVMIGYGRGNQHKSINGVESNANIVNVIPFESGFYSHYSITNWLGVEAGIGIRFSLINTSSFNGSFYSFGINIFPEPLLEKFIQN
jgi:hypothetical protein